MQYTRGIQCTIYMCTYVYVYIYIYIERERYTHLQHIVYVIPFLSPLALSPPLPSHPSYLPAQLHFQIYVDVDVSIVIIIIIIIISSSSSSNSSSISISTVISIYVL